ncbi:facilitated trehalose transporter Tret1 [Spodoptera frugiperda]|uniref:Facilitated trehalose transporter Tret1 n=1 Tax=Spodoptera frugiperda TaxID=7108 RepID=A0A9R0DY16_SPOFR|nr:facilitated trehalose transporter Tret1 [Spodoptera frugiperda]XP_035457063.2 facilitated trehalose transporter Tret1 [Spodoptera frugiperda]XP_050555254.1 facilitated trehalose transporter Tret1 [Spodoptera frugiperda]
MTAPLLRQTWTMSAVLINMFGQGLVLSFPSSLLPALSRPDSPIKADLHTASWLGSIVGVAGIPGFFISSFLMDMFGRKVTHALVILPAIVGWVMIYFSQDITVLMTGRFLGGLSSAATVSLGAVVIGEYTSPKYRGVFLYLKNASVCMGAMFIHIISGFLHWRTIALVACTPLLFAFFVVCTWPESPAWLLSKQQYDKSEKAFYWLRGNNEASRREITDTIKAQRERMAKPKLTQSYGEQIKDFLKKFTQKDFVKPVFITLLATIVLEMSGRHIFPAYLLHIMSEMTGEKSQSFYYTLGSDIIITASALFASILVKMMNRRTLLFSTGFAAFGVLMAVCTYLFLEAKGIIPGGRSWIPMSLLIVYFILANLGCAPIPLALVGEVFPLSHRGAGLALSGVWISLGLIVGLKSTPHLIDSIKVYGFFAVYGIIMAISLVILYFMMPETKDRTLQEIENYFNYGRFANVDDDDEEANTKMINE